MGNTKKHCDQEKPIAPENMEQWITIAYVTMSPKEIRNVHTCFRNSITTMLHRYKWTLLLYLLWHNNYFIPLFSIEWPCTIDCWNRLNICYCTKDKKVEHAILKNRMTLESPKHLTKKLLLAYYGPLDTHNFCN